MSDAQSILQKRYEDALAHWNKKYKILNGQPRSLEWEMNKAMNKPNKPGYEFCKNN